MRAPRFWGPQGPTTILGRLAQFALAPVSSLFTLGARHRQAGTEGETVGIPVICVGNLVVGGAGKTPTVEALLSLPSLLTRKPHVLSRGYGGSLHGPIQVDPYTHTVSDVGDEPLMLAARVSVWVSRDRPQGAKAAKAAGAEAIVMDDGYQNPSLHKDLALLVVDGTYGFGNGRVMPAGPLREPIADGLARADALVLIGEDKHGIAEMAAQRPEGPLPVHRARLTPTGDALSLSGQRVIAFAGIARPEKLFQSLQMIGCELAGTIGFPDHHPYAPEEIASLLRQAEEKKAELVTTSKDFVRLPPEIRHRLRLLGVTLVWEDPDALDQMLAGCLGVQPAREWSDTAREAAGLLDCDPAPPPPDGQDVRVWKYWPGHDGDGAYADLDVAEKHISAPKPYPLPASMPWEGGHGG